MFKILALVLGLVTLGGTVALGGPEDAADARPNIVLVISDDQDYEHLGFMGHPMVKTPTIDALAEEGIVFTTAHLPMSRCRPTLASLLSGRYPHQTGVYYNYGRASLPGTGSLPMLLRDAGYATFASGKFWEGDPRAMGFTHGEGKTAARFVREHQDDAFAFLDEVAGKKPFFMWWAPKLPHTPHNPPRRLLDLYDPDDIPVPDGIVGTKERFRRKEHRLLAMVSWLDEGLAALTAKLRERKVLDDTLFVFLIDNGWCNGRPSKGSPFEKGVRTPVVLRWPGRVPAGRRTDALVSTLDLFPTLLEVAGVKVPDGLPGRSLRPLIEGRTEAGRDVLCGAVYPAFATPGDERPERDAYAIHARDRRWKYVRYLRDVRKERNGDSLRIQAILTDFPTREADDEDLYDLDADPHERRNVAADPRNREHLVRLRKLAAAWWTETGGKPFPQEERTEAAAGPATGKRPNIVYIFADDLGYGELGCYGQTKIRTPHIDQLAREGMRFTQHYSGSPVCAPSRCTLLTGLHTGHAYVRDNKGRPIVGQLPIPPDTVTVGKLLQMAGYRTGVVGKWGLGGPDTTGLPNRQGFDFFYGYLDQWRAHSYYPDYLWRNDEKVPLPGNRDGRQETYSHDLVTDAALEFLGDAKGDAKADRPFCLFVAYTVPHVSLHVPADSLKEYAGRWPETPYTGGHYAGHETPRAAYAAMITRMDRDVGRLLARLEERGLADDTLVIFSSDNGPTWAGGVDHAFFESAGPLRGLKGSLYEGGIRVPMIARWPGKIAAGSRSDLVCANWDMLPTFTHLAGAETTKGLDGVSIVPTLLGKPEEQDAREHLYWEHRSRMQAVRLGDWKAHRKHPNAKIELYDLKNDVAESTDVSSKHPAIVERMARIMVEGRTPSEHFPLKAPGPRRELSPENLVPRDGWKLVAVDSESRFNGKLGPNAFDEDSTTIWHTEWRDRKPGHPHELVIDLGRSTTIRGLRYLARQDGTNGMVREFELYVGDDATRFGEPALKGTLEKVQTEQERTCEPVRGRYVKFRTLSAHDDLPVASVAELGLVGDQGK